VIAEERRSRIVDLVNENGSMSVTDLMQILDTSESTIRRDLSVLHRAGRLRRVHGGATKISQAEFVMSDQSFAGRQELHVEEKRAIGAYAATLIGPDDFVFIDGGTTTECLVDAITQTDAIFLTNSLPHAQKLLAKGCRTILPGGEVKQSTEVLVGAETVNHIRRYHFTIGFWGTNGVGLESGYTTPEFGEAAVKQIALEHTVRPFVLCDSSKFSKVSLITFADYDAATLITDRIVEPVYRQSGNIVEVGQQQ
jgi:DeoR family fructose operon transcriptional repressor